MKIKPCMYNKVIESFIKWREDNNMPATVNFYQKILARVGGSEFSDWAKIGYVRGDLSLFLLNKMQSKEDRLKSLDGLDTTEKRIIFFEENYSAFIEFANERFLPFSVPLEQIKAIANLGEKTPRYPIMVDEIITKIVFEMGGYYRHFVYHELDRTDVCETEADLITGLASEGG